MKVNALRIAASLAGALILSSAASASFVQLVTESKNPVAGAPGTAGHNFFVCNVYACFTSTSDRLLSVTQATITSTQALYQDAFGGSTAPSQAFIGIVPSLAYDSFVTIGLKTNPGTDSTSLEPGGAFSTSGFTGGWFNSNPDNTQGQPVTVATLPGGRFYVLIAQLTIDSPTGGAANISGDMLVAWNTGAGSGTTISSASFTRVPGPAALALLGVAGLAGRRRRA